MSSNRPNPLGTVAVKIGGVLSALGGLVTYLVTSGIITATQGEALTAAGADAQATVSHVGGAVAGVLAIVAGLAAAFGTARSGAEEVTPVSDPRSAVGIPLVEMYPTPEPPTPLDHDGRG